MKNALLSFTLMVTIILTVTTAKSQDIDFERWEIGIDMLPLIGKNVAPPSVSIKKLELKQKEKEFGLARKGPRLRVGCNISSPNDAFPFNTNNYDILVRPGYEWDRKIKSVEVFFAMDVVAYFQNSYGEGTDGLGNLTYRNQRISLGASPVFGINYKIIKNIKVSLETATDFLATRTSSTNQIGPDTYKTTNNGLTIRLSPIYVLNAVFVF